MGKRHGRRDWEGTGSRRIFSAAGLSRKNRGGEKEGRKCFIESGLGEKERELTGALLL